MIHVVFGVDGYVAQMAVSMVSMYESNRNNQIQTYVVCLNLNEDEKNKLIELAFKYHRTIEFLYIDQDKLKNLKIFFHLSHATFYRLFIPAMLPQLKKIIYLDCDILVEADLSELWNIDMNGYGNGGVIFNGDDTEKRLGVEGGKDMNAGILVMNLEFWRDNNITYKCTEWLEKTESAYMDNDAMNVILNGYQLGVEERWNLNPIHFEKYSDEAKFPSRILHFAGAIKPWHKAYDFKFQERYFNYLLKTPWSDNYVPEEPWNISQSISVANQYYLNQDYDKACGYYSLAIKFRLSKQKLESLEILETINEGINFQNTSSFDKAALKFRSVIDFWKFPLTHICNIYQYPNISSR